MAGQANATQYVELVDRQADACEPSYAPRPKLSATAARVTRRFVSTIFVATSAPCANGMRPHKGRRVDGRDQSRNGDISATPPGDLLKTEQVDQQAGHVRARRRSFKGGAGIAPPTRSPDHRATGPPASAIP